MEWQYHPYTLCTTLRYNRANNEYIISYRMINNPSSENYYEERSTNLHIFFENVSNENILVQCPIPHALISNVNASSLDLRNWKFWVVFSKK